MKPGEVRENRRRFFQTSGRCLGLGGLAALVIANERKRQRLEGDPNCLKLSTCSECVEFSGCTRPKAEQFRKG